MTDSRIESGLGQRAYQRLLSTWLRLSRGRLPWGVSEVAFVRKAALGDVLMATAALREFRARNPKAKIHFFTDFVELVNELPYFDSVDTFESRPAFHFNLRYEESSKTEPRHWARIYSEALGITPKSVKPDCNSYPEKTRRWKERLASLRRPIVAVHRKAGDWTPNKDWPESYWDSLVDRLSERLTVVEIGSQVDTGIAVRGPNYLDTRGETTLQDLVGIIGNCDLLVGPVSGPGHLAAALNVKSLTICSGYEHPDFTRYPTSTMLYEPVECAPCWLRTPCPYKMKCMTTISVEQVMQRVFELVS